MGRACERCFLARAAATCSLLAVREKQEGGRRKVRKKKRKEKKRKKEKIWKISKKYRIIYIVGQKLFL
jgi:hypothetical protein